MKLIVVFCLCLLVGCNAPGLQFQGVAPTRITVDGSTFDVRVKGNLAEAIRVNAQYAPGFGKIRPKAAEAIRRVSGCRVKNIKGDQAQAIASLGCS